jgi:signal transduction histidine kinase
LRRKGFEAIGVESGLLGLRLLNRDYFDALVSDIKMPYMDGVAFAEKAKKLNPNLVVILLTGHASFDSAQQAIKIGINDYLTKPVDLDKLQGSLDEGLRRAEEKNSSLEYYQRLEKDLIEDKKKLESMKEELMNLISHELRTPVTIISACFDLLKDTMEIPSDEKMKVLNEQEKKHILSGIERGRRRLINIIEDVNCYMNLVRGEAKLERSEFEFNNVLDNNFEALKNLIRERKAIFKKELEATKGIRVNLCKERILDALERLVNNAAFHNPEGTEIILKTNLITDEESGSKKRFIEIQVCDNGRGIEKPILENIFTPFSSGDMKQHKEGVGMGLCISKKIVELHGGRLSIDSKPEKGTTVTIELPISS